MKHILLLTCFATSLMADDLADINEINFNEINFSRTSDNNQHPSTFEIGNPGF